MSAKYNTAVYCRQSVCTSVASIMGQNVLAVDHNGAPHLRVYAHCSKGSAGITLLIINLSNQTDFTVNVKNVLEFDTAARSRNTGRGSNFGHGLKRTVSWVGLKASDGPLHGKEYHLTPKDGNLRNKIMVLNGVPLEITKDGNIPELEPVLVPTNSPLSITSLSIKFVVLLTLRLQLVDDFSRLNPPELLYVSLVLACRILWANGNCKLS
ncbi:putative glycosidase [Rosa chinensis]|uniref:Putative glycosidase n=1 Tax=Rosa chinensis TaxID=74649 RepID=A0A2P6P2Z7_ROSCH|nr:putative glycosidase [Rosa chinensis]